MKILIVDDSKTMRYVLAAQLKEIGYTDIIEANCVDNAKAMAVSSVPSLIISDWNMPGASGLDLLKFIRGNETTKAIPFVMLTTDTDRNKIVDATRAGLQSYIVKPIRKPLLIEKLQELSSAYGFQVPIDDKNKPSQSAQVAQAADHPLKGKIKGDQIPAMMEAYAKVCNGESTLTTFEEYVAKELFGGSAEEKGDEVKLFVDTIHNVAMSAVNDRLNYFV